MNYLPNGSVSENSSEFRKIFHVRASKESRRIAGGGGGHYFNRIKNFRGVATRYEELAANDLGMATPASIRIWLRSHEITAMSVTESAFGATPAEI